MLRESTIEKWKPLIEGYDKSTETIEAYCKRLDIDEKKYFYYRKLMEREAVDPKSPNIEILPVIIKHSGRTRIQVNGVTIEYESRDISDENLRRIFRVCKDL